MITLFSGTPGSGKSYHAVDLAITELMNKNIVIANFDLTFNEKQLKKGYQDRFFYYPNEEITISKLIIFALEHGLLEKPREGMFKVIIDEAGGRYNCREFAKSDRQEWVDFFSQHRKLGFDFILVAQHDRMLDKQIRICIETEIKHRKVNNFGVFKKIPWTFFVAIEYWYAAKLRVRSEFIPFRKRIANQYNSMKIFSGFKLSNELLQLIENKQKQIRGDLDVNINAVFSDGD